MDNSYAKTCKHPKLWKNWKKACTSSKETRYWWSEQLLPYRAINNHIRPRSWQKDVAGCVKAKIYVLFVISTFQQTKWKHYGIFKFEGKRDLSLFHGFFASTSIHIFTLLSCFSNFLSKTRNQSQEINFSFGAENTFFLLMPCDNRKLSNAKPAGKQCINVRLQDNFSLSST